MKYILTLILLVGMCTANAQRQQMPDRAQIMSVLAAQQAAWNRGDLDEFMIGYWKSDSLSFIGRKGIMRGWNGTLANYKKSYPDRASMGILSFDIISVDLMTKTCAYVVGKWNLKRKKGNIGGHFTLLWKKVNNRWVIVSDHSS